jgi:predicted  nucleic acid-binding Zn-ribbon protein
VPPPARGKPESRPDSADDDEPTRANDPPGAAGPAAAATATTTTSPRPPGPPPGLDDSGFAEQQKASVKPDPSKGVMKRILDATPIPGPEILRPVGAAAPDAPPKRPSSPGFEVPQATVVDDAPAGLVAGAGPRGSRGDPTVVPSGDDGASRPPALPAPPLRADPSQGSTNRFERGDPTGVMPEDDGAEPERDDATVAQRSPTVGLTATINLRPEAMLPRKRGVLGDVRYVFTVLFGTARARREAVTVGHAIARQLHERKQRLVALGRAAIVSERFDHPALVTAREQLAEIEEDRSHHAGAIASADDELEHVKRERAKRAKQTAEAIAAQRTELAAIAQKLAPLEKEAVAIRRKAGDLAEQLKKVDTKIRTTEASLTSVKTRKEDRAGVLAEIATLKADREAVQRDEPALAEQLDRLAPRMAGLEAKHHDAQAKITELEADEATDQQRALELIAAIEAKKKVVERSHGDAEARRDKALHGLAERLLIDRPSQLGRAFEPIDEIDLQIATDGRRAMELRELLGSVDRGAMARGIALMAVVIIGAGAGVVLALL